MGLFFYTQKGSIISTVDLPTTEIIEPEKAMKGKNFHSFFYQCDDAPESASVAAASPPP